MKTFRFFSIIIAACILHTIHAQESLQQELSKKVNARAPFSGSIFNNILAQLQIPQASINIVKGLFIKTPVPIKLPGELTSGTAFEGDVFFKGKDTKIKVVVGQTLTNPEAFSLSLALPAGWKLSDISSQLSYLDELSLTNGQLIYSNFMYKDLELATEVQAGLNFVADIALKPPLTVLNKLMANQKKLNGLVVEGGAAKFKGTVAPDITQSSFLIDLPLRFGVNFEALAKNPTIQNNKDAEKVAQAVAKVIKEITSDTFTVEVTPPPSVGFSVGSGVRLLLATQKEPISFDMSGQLVAGAQEALNMVGQMKGPLHLAQWLTFSDAGLEIDWDFALISELAAVGIPLPFTGLGMSGWVYLGKEGDKQAAINLTGGLRFKQGDKFPSEFAFQGIGKNLDFKYVVQFLAEKIAKKRINASIPTMMLKDFIVKASPVPTKFIGEKYEAGMLFDGNAQLFDVDASLHFSLNPDPTVLAMTGNGKASVINITSQGKKLFTLSGSKPNEGPSLSFLVSAKNPEATNFMFDGTLDIPVLGIREQVKNLRVELDRISGTFESKLGNLLDVDATVNIQPSQPLKSEVDLAFKQNIVDVLSKSVSAKLRAAKVQFEKTKAEKELEEKKQEFHDKCKGTNYFKHIKTCSKLSAEITALGTKVAAEKTKQAFDPKRIKDILEEIAQKALVPALKAFEIKEMSASWKASQGLPVINKMVIHINVASFKKVIELTNISFDPKNIAKDLDTWANLIVKEIINQIK
ncbi:MAG: hypothetical protein AB7R69_01745 [Candidatus Babeliales bacterium]